MADDATTLAQNLKSLLKIHGKALEILKAAKNKDYIYISKEVKVHHTIVSLVLNRARKFGYVEKNNNLWVKTKEIRGLNLYKSAEISSSLISENKDKNENKEETFNKVKKRALKVSGYAKQITSIKGVDAVEKMSEAYVWLYITENTLRNFIRTVLGQTNTWWKIGVNSDIQRKVAEAIRDYPYDGAKRKDELEHTHLGQLSEIITSKTNWSKFQPYIYEKNKANFQLKVGNAIPTRNSIGHCIPLDKDDSKEVETRFKDILKMLK